MDSNLNEQAEKLIAKDTELEKLQKELEDLKIELKKKDLDSRRNPSRMSMETRPSLNSLFEESKVIEEEFLEADIIQKSPEKTSQEEKEVDETNKMQKKIDDVFKSTPAVN